MKKPSREPKRKPHRKKREKPLTLNMTFDEAITRLSKTPPPKKG